MRKKLGYDDCVGVKEENVNENRLILRPKSSYNEAYICYGQGAVDADACLCVWTI